MTWTSVASDVLTALFVAVPTAFFTVHLSLKRFYKQKWWESKRTTYMELFSALYHIKRIEEDWYYQVRYPEQHNSDGSIGDAKLATEQRYTLEKTIDLSSFLISEEASSILQEYVADKKVAKREDPDHTVTHISQERRRPAGGKEAAQTESAIGLRTQHRIGGQMRLYLNRRGYPDGQGDCWQAVRTDVDRRGSGDNPNGRA